MPVYSKDPFWLNAKYGGKCSKCQKEFNKGDKVFYYPLTKDIFFDDCANAASRDFNSLASDEDMYNM